jgi:hypothetical protein
LHLAAFAFFQRLKLFSLFSKHGGFSEEREWRVVYMRDRDENKVLDKMFGYSIGKTGVQPRLKLKISPVDGTTEIQNLSQIINKIIFGPLISSPLVKASILKMIDQLGKPELKDRVVASTIPFRSSQ